MIFWTRRAKAERAYYHGAHYARMGCFPSRNPYADGTRDEREFDRGWRETARFLVHQMDIERKQTVIVRRKVDSPKNASGNSLLAGLTQRTQRTHKRGGHVPRSKVEKETTKRGEY